MPSLAARKPCISVEEYLDGERRSEIHHEHIDGQVYAVGGASDR